MANMVKESNAMNGVIDKVKKLLSLANEGSNNSLEEAQSAALMAQKLMSKYGIKDVNIDDSDTESDSIEVERVSVEDSRKWYRMLASIVANNFRCKVFIEKSTDSTTHICFVGKDSDTSIASEVFNFLYSFIKKHANSYVYFLRSKGKSTNGIFNAYVSGALKGIKSALDAQCIALMLVRDSSVDEKFDEITKGFKTKTISLSAKNVNHNDGMGAYNAGYETGKSAMERRKIANA